MCEPISASIGVAALGAAVSLYASQQQTKAANQQQQAIYQSNQSQQAAQNQAFTERINAGMRQTAAQTAAQQETLNTRSVAANQMRTSQMDALKNYQDAINAQNTTAEDLRQTGDTAAKQLLQETNAQQLAASQTQQQQQAAALLDPSVPKTAGGPEASDPSGGNNAVTSDAVSQGATARRMAEAATNIRTYGAKTAAVQAYNAPTQLVGQAIARNQMGIMPAQTAEQLLRAGSATQLLPSKVAYQAATGLGNSQDILLQSKGQNALDAASLSYGNATDLANLQQSDADTIAANKLAQQTAQNQFLQQQAGVIGGFGQLAAYGAGRYLGSPSSANPSVTNLGSIFTSKPDAATAY
jgi:hypothetical protein